MAWHRRTLQDLVAQQRARAARCPYVPLYLLLLLCGALSFALRADVAAGGEARAFLASRLEAQGAWREDGTVALGGADSALAWLGRAWVEGLLGDAGARGVLVGGVRLSQWRAPASACRASTSSSGSALPGYALALLPDSGAGAPCAAAGQAPASAPFGPAARGGGSPWDAAFAPPPSALRASLAAANPYAAPASALPGAFSLALRAPGAEAALAGVAAAGWVDAATLALEGAGAAIMPALGR